MFRLNLTQSVTLSLTMAILGSPSRQASAAPASPAKQHLASPWPAVIAHRGYSLRTPENTLPAFREAVRAGADFVELDYYHSADGVPVVIHDDTLDRTSNGKAVWGGREIPVKSHSAESLQTLDAGSWFSPEFENTRIPLLTEALDVILPSSIPLIERKGGDAATLIGLLRDRRLLDSVVVQAFDWEFIRNCHNLAPDLALGALGPPSRWKGRELSDDEKALSREFIQTIHSLGAQVIGWNRQVDAQSIALAHRYGLQVWVYTLNKPEDAANLVRMGVDGIITDDPTPIAKEIAPESDKANPDFAHRSIPRPLIDHPGNIYLEGEAVHIAASTNLPNDIVSWQLKDDGHHILRRGIFGSDLRPGEFRDVALGTLGIGWYRLEYLDDKREVRHWTTAAVLKRLEAPTPQDSPVSVDSATAWFARDDVVHQEQLARLAALAGVNWVRDRLRWREMEPLAGQFAENGHYDTSAVIQNRNGLNVLQVWHDTPQWAVAPGQSRGRFADDLRHVHRFSRQMADRFRGLVQAWEPWNEANVQTFGAHTVDEMCSWQKAAFLGFKHAHPNLLVGWNAAAAVPTRNHTEGLLANAVWPYFDTYNYHTYDWPHAYANLWEPARAASTGKPIWITEADRGMKHDNAPPFYDLSPEGERLKAELIAQEYAQSLSAGANQHFHFILGHYCEPNGVQFGLLRQDLTPRPAYVALAAAGRLLAGAQCLGRWNPAEDVHVFAFRGLPDGQDREVFVLWAEKEVDWPARGRTVADWPLPAGFKVDRVFDYLGRDLGENTPHTIGSAPVYAIAQRGAGSGLPLQPPPPRPTLRGGDPCSVVLQVLLADAERVKVEDRPWSEAYAWSIGQMESCRLEVRVYNFGPQTVRGKLRTVSPNTGWQIHLTQDDLALAPMERVAVAGQLQRPSGTPPPANDQWIQLQGDFGTAGQPKVAFRVLAGSL